MAEVIVGIDLGTTNSEIAAFIDDNVQVLATAGEQIMPSVVGLAADGALLVGTSARNQYVLYPERTIKSIKREMGTDHQVTLGNRTYSPPEISAMILRTLKTRAEAVLGTEVHKAVITVPAYFSDAQRQATRDAGQIAGLEVVRILNEPTAAALAYGEDRQGARTILVYDLGGGTFDVSLVYVEGEITEVLASHGNNRLGGDDFDQLLLDFVHERFVRSGGVDVHTNPRAMSRLLRAVEEAKKRLSFEPYTRIREEHLTERDGLPVHLDLEVTRTEYEQLIRPLLEGTLDSVHRALTDAGKRPEEVDEILLVGGATRTPLVSMLLEEKTGLTPRQELHPDLCVAFGAGVLAARISGHDIERVLVDISPYSFGPSHFGILNGMPSEHCYRPIIVRNTPLPISRTETYLTMVDNQEGWQVSVYQGDDEYALNNILVGRFIVEGFSKVPAGNEILCRMDLDLDGILRVTATEKRTGLSKHITIEGATTAMSEAAVAAAQAQMRSLFGQDLEAGAEEGEWSLDAEDELDELDELEGEEEATEALAESSGEATKDDARDRRVQISEARAVLERSRRLLDTMNNDDREEAISLHERIENALNTSDTKRLHTAMTELADLLFYVEEK
ncbi:MAG: heat-shock protein Hsp70 [Deltaproteobacteria bacterium]|nr:heat-shock protein Hsp70 [Deltaproteobacteria bacterium]